MNSPLLKQLMRFGIIGIIATLLHAVIFHTLHTQQTLSSIPANLISFAVAFTFSYLGHLKWTFAVKQRVQGTASTKSKQTLRRFFATALLGLSINILAGWLLIDYAQLPHYYFLGVAICCTPVLTFVLSKYWAFKT